MSQNNYPLTKFHPALILIHWITALLIIAVYICMEFHDVFPKGSDPRRIMKSLHFMLGMSVLALVGVRLSIRFLTKVPPIVPEPKPIEVKMAAIMHFALYIFMIVMPILGWLIFSANGKPVPFFGLEIPPLIDKNKELHDLFEEIHEWGATIGYFLVGGHALAGLFHHYSKKDNTLLRMSFIKK